MSQIVSNERLNRGKEIEEHLNRVNIEPWFYIYIKNVKIKPELE